VLIGLIACDNGLGHIRRLYVLGLRFAEMGHEVELLCATRKFLGIRDIYGGHLRLANVAFSAPFRKDLLMKGGSPTEKFLTFLPDLDKYEKVISDNLLDVLYRRPDAIISGHFLWHYVPKIKQFQYKEESEALLSLMQPRVVATGMFAMEEIKRLPNYRPTGLYLTDIPRASPAADSVLITGGTTRIIDDQMLKIAERLSREKNSKGRTIFVDPLIYKHIEHEDIKPASYTRDMYAKISIAILRPGVGTVTELISVCAGMYLVAEPGDGEMESVVTSLEKLNIAERYTGQPLMGLWDKEHKFELGYDSINQGIGGLFDPKLFLQ